MKIMFLRVNASQSMLWSPRISLSYILKPWMEIVRAQNVRPFAEFYPHDFFREGAFFSENFGKIEIFEFLKKSQR